LTQHEEQQFNSKTAITQTVKKLCNALLNKFHAK